MIFPGGNPVNAFPGEIPTFPLIVDGPVLVMVVAANIVIFLVQERDPEDAIGEIFGSFV
jgi:hypothetical protein